MVKVAQITKPGGPEVISWQDVELPSPGADEVRVRNRVIGLNFIDTYHRSGLYPVPLPAELGVEAVGVVEAVGADVKSWRVGDRVGMFGPTRGSYAEARNISASELLPIPDDIPDETAAALLVKGGTAEALIERCAKIKAGMTVLVHAAAGGVGSILVEWLKALGVTVIGTVGSKTKAEVAKAAGVDHIILYRDEPVAGRVRALTYGVGVPVVFDGVGKATWEASLDSCASRGLVVSYGNASGAVSDVELGILARKGSLFVTRPMFYDYYRDPAEREASINRLWQMVREEKISAHIGQRYALEEVARAHQEMEARQTVGASLLLL